MPMVKKSIAVTDQQDDWIKSQIASGLYGNDSELMRDLIRREQARGKEIEAIRTALIEGEESGLSDRMPEQIRQAVIDRKRDHGQL